MNIDLWLMRRSEKGTRQVRVEHVEGSVFYAIAEDASDPTSVIEAGSLGDSFEDAARNAVKKFEEKHSR